MRKGLLILPTVIGLIIVSMGKSSSGLDGSPLVWLDFSYTRF